MTANQNTRIICKELVRANLGTCCMYLDLAKSELKAGERRLAEQSFSLARISHEAILRFLGKLDDERQVIEVQTSLIQIEKKLEMLRSQFKADAAILEPKAAASSF